MLWEAASGREPFRRPDDPNDYEQLHRRAEPVGLYRELPPDLSSVIDACLEPAPKNRPTVADVWSVVEPLLE